jgi:hypothetical protein
MTGARRLKSVPATQRERAPDLRDAVRTAVAAMDWLTDSDHAMRTLALRQAEEIEKAVDRAEELAAIVRDAQGAPDIYKRLAKLEAMCEVTKTVGWLGPQLQGVLRDLGGTPGARGKVKPDKPVGSRLAQLRDAAGQHDTEDLHSAAD